MKKILVVDDNLTSLKQINSQLADSYATTLAKSGTQALQICAREKPDLILLDIEMPEISGFEVIATLKKDPEIAKIPVIFLTGNQDTATELRGLESGAVDFITKPVEKPILLNRIRLHMQFSAYQLSLENTVKDLQSSIVLSFAELIESKDHNSGGHVLRTGKYVRILGQALLEQNTFGDKLTPEILDTIVEATHFHDIGKLGISDIILMKDSPLTEEEYADVKAHTVIGARVLGDIYKLVPAQKSLEYAITFARSHHEQFNGAGYPDGLAGESIPLGIRIMSVANVYDSCTTGKAYRPAMSHEYVCSIISKGKGTEFDPRIVEVFEKISDSFRIVRQEQAALGMV